MNIDEMNESTEPNENVKRKRFSLDYVYMFFIAAAMILCLVAALGFFIAAGWIGIKEFATIVVEKADYDAVAHISAGVITDKEIINGHTKSSKQGTVLMRTKPMFLQSTVYISAQILSITEKHTKGTIILM